MKLAVGTDPVPLDTSQSPDTMESGLILIVQNLGPGSVFFDFRDDVTADTGVRVGAGGAYEFSRAPARTVYLVSDSEADVRWTAVD